MKLPSCGHRLSLETLEAEVAEAESALNEADRKLAEADKELEVAVAAMSELARKRETLGDSEGRRGRAGEEGRAVIMAGGQV